MNTRISPDDPRLTACALGEMEAAERAEFEVLLQQDPAARATVEEIRRTARMLGAALEGEPAPAVTPLKLEAPAAEPGRAKILRFPRFYYIISGAAAACFALFFAYWQQTRPMESAAEKQRYIEYDLTGKKAGADAARPAPAEANTPMAVAALPPPPEPVEVPDMAPRPLVAAARSQGMPVLQPTGKQVMASAEAAPRFNTESYAREEGNPFLAVAQNPLSTFAADVDTASYANMRRFLTQGQLPPRDAVRIEELVNYFPYRYAPPAAGRPFAASLEVATAPWAPAHRLVRIGLKGREVSAAARPRANLVFLLDVSGSMNEPNKLPLVQESLRLLTRRLRADDRVAIVSYAGASGLALPSTSAAETAKILEGIDSLAPGGPTNGEAGIQLAYDIARANFVPGGINRVILATDGDFNVGVTGQGELVRLIEEKAKSGVFLSVLGFGMGNYKDDTLERLADKGNGNYAYIDTAAEARKALVEQASGTLVTIARDVKLQVEFNPAQVQAYRLIGYENRLLAKEDFNNDKVDAGEIGAGHTVTALYEIVPVGAPMPETGTVDPLKYQRAAPGAASPARSAAADGELLTVKIRYKEPAGEVSTKLEFPLRDTGARFEEASQDFKFAAAVAAFGMILRDSPYKGAATLPEVERWARAGLGQDAGGHRAEFLGLVKRAGSLGLN